MQNLLGDHPQARGLRDRGELRTATGDGRVPLVDVDDIAGVVGSVLEAAEPANREIVVTGPRAWSYDEVAALLTRKAGRPVTHRRLTAEQVRDEVFGDLPPWLGLDLGEMDEQIAGGAWSEPTREVLAVTGHAPRSLEDFVSRHHDELLP